MLTILPMLWRKRTTACWKYEVFSIKMGFNPAVDDN
jgi:hypothetical protein